MCINGHDICTNDFVKNIGGERKMRMSARAKILNQIPKENSKTQQEKRETAKKNYRSRITCEKCKNGNATLYNIEGHYICKNCREKEEN